MHLVRRGGLGLPQQSRDALQLLVDKGHLPPGLAEALMRMVGFRNCLPRTRSRVAVQDHQALNLAVVRAIVEGRLGDFEAFAAWAIAQLR